MFEGMQLRLPEVKRQLLKLGDILEAHAQGDGRSVGVRRTLHARPAARQRRFVNSDLPKTQMKGDQYHYG